MGGRLRAAKKRFYGLNNFNCKHKVGGALDHPGRAPEACPPPAGALFTPRSPPGRMHVPRACAQTKNTNFKGVPAPVPVGPQWTSKLQHSTYIFRRALN